MSRTMHTEPDIDLAGVLAHTKALEGRVDSIERTLEAHGRRLDKGLGEVGRQLAEMSRALSVQQARPEFNVKELLAVVVSCVVLFSAAATGIVTLATYVAAGPQIRLEERMAGLRERVDRWDRAAERAMERHLAEFKK